MKKLSSNVTFLLLIAIATTAKAQVENASLKELSFTSEHTAKSVADPKIVSKFQKLFPDAIDESWSKTREGGLSVTFYSNNIRELTFLNKHGNVESEIRYLSEKQLPGDVRSTVNFGYPLYSIKCGQEIHHSDIVAYLVTIERDHDWKVIRVINGETDVYEEYTK